MRTLVFSKTGKQNGVQHQILELWALSSLRWELQNKLVAVTKALEGKIFSFLKIQLENKIFTLLLRLLP